VCNMIPTPTHLLVEREGHHRHPDAQLRTSSMVDFLLGLSLPRPYAVACAERSTSGLISTPPVGPPGIRAAMAIATSRSLTSMM